MAFQEQFVATDQVPVLQEWVPASLQHRALPLSDFDEDCAGALAQCKIWRVDHNVAVEPENLAFLTEADRLEFAAIMHSGVRSRSLRTRAALRQALSEYTHGALAPGDWRFSRGINGRPVLSPESAVTFGHIDFSCSHTPWTSVVAISDSGRIGVDIEVCQCGYDEALAMHFLSAAERHQVRALPEGERGQAFARLWTLKEAYIKAIGEGLSEDLGAISFDVISDKHFFAEPTFLTPNDAQFASWPIVSAGGRLFASIARVEA